MRTVAIKLTSPEAIRAACELTIVQGTHHAEVMYKSEHFEDDDYVGADLEEFAEAKNDPEQFEEFCGGRRHSWELWVYEWGDESKSASTAPLPPDSAGPVVVANFEIEHSKDDFPDRVHVKIDGKFNVAIVRTPEGIVLDVYPEGWDSPIDTMTVWDEDVPSAEEEGA